MAEVSKRAEIEGGVVVGHDGSESADRALRWAARLADATRDPLHVLRAWVVSNAPRPASWSIGYAPPMTDYEAAVAEQLTADVEACGLPDGVDVRLHVVNGAAGRCLVEASEQADHIVVSARGRGGFTGLLLGSTSDQLVRHSKCPVTVMRS